MKNLLYLLVLSFTLSLVACSGGHSLSKTQDGRSAQEEQIQEKKTRRAVEEVNSLEDYLRRIPGLIVSSGTVRIRGYNSSFLSNQPLFVVDGVRMGNELARVSGLVDVKQIERVRILKEVSETALYGLGGSHGVIVIEMRKGGAH
ncbi:MAG: TonB-dependent receptor plug domain-containing protein [Bacteroidota bacterium]